MDVHITRTPEEGTFIPQGTWSRTRDYDYIHNNCSQVAVDATVQERAHQAQPMVHQGSLQLRSTRAGHQTHCTTFRRSCVSKTPTSLAGGYCPLRPASPHGRQHPLTLQAIGLAPVAHFPVTGRWGSDLAPRLQFPANRQPVREATTAKATTLLAT